MINKDRIVPITAVDLISMYGLILKQTATSLEAVEADNVEGDFVITEDKTLIANEPVKSVDFTSGVTSAGLYFVAGYDYTGKFTSQGVEITSGGDEVLKDGKTLYFASLDGGAVSIEKVGF